MYFFIFLLMVGANANAVPLQEMGVKLIELRAAVEEKGMELQEAQKQSQAQLEPLIQRKTEVEAQLRKESLRALQLQEKAKVLGATIAKTQPNVSSEYQLLAQWLDNLEMSIQNSLPFRREERITQLKQIRQRIQQKQDSPLGIASELWSATERELKLTSDNEYQIGSIQLDGQTYEAEIIKLGMILMLFKTSQGQLGYAQLDKDGWQLVTTQDAEMKSAVERSINKFKDRHTSGWFEVPGIKALIERSL